jgi:HPt (histidine-containing phosphotransfer) domain-containing protein
MEQFGDEEVVNEIYAEYARSLQEKIPELENAIAQQNWNGLDSVAHAVKGNALAAGDTDIANVAIAMRTSAKMSDGGSARTLLEKIKSFAKEV